NAQQHGQKFLGDRERIRTRIVLGGQNPAADPLLKDMEAIAGGCLGDLVRRRMNIAKEQALQPAALLELLLQNGFCDVERSARDLNHCFMKRCGDAQENLGRSYSFYSLCPNLD